MDLRAVAFPVLIAATDGWVQYLSSAEELSRWTISAIKKYNGRRVVLYDSNDHAWLVDGIRIATQLAKLLHTACDGISDHTIDQRIR